ncbi:MAG: sn-glycerol-3-phosphate ABC transporter ATP-binding protein UgpC [Devosia sp.]
MAVVDLNTLVKRYPGSSEAAVDRVSLTIADKEFMVLLGPSGCGKSTTLRMIAGLESITEGTLSIDGAVMNAVPAKDRDIAMVFQSYALYPHMSVRQNMAFGLKRRGVARSLIDTRVADTAETLALTPYLDRKPFALSGGQRQRVALGRAIVRDPKVFLLDEPLSNLDASLRVSTRGELIKQHARLGTTMIYVTHDQVEAMTMGSRICIMNGGRIAQVGAPMDVYRYPADTFVAGFLGSPGMNLLEVPVAQGPNGLVAQVGGTPLPLPPGCRVDGDRVIVGIRPEDLYEPDDIARLTQTAEIAARVTAVEPLGADTLTLLSMEGQSKEVMARFGRDTPARSGDTLSVVVDVSAVRYFSLKTGAALLSLPTPT